MATVSPNLLGGLEFDTEDEVFACLTDWPIPESSTNSMVINNADQMDELQGRFQFLDESAVRRFLESEYELPTGLHDLARIIDRVMPGSTPPLTLELVPETEESDAGILVSIECELGPDEALQAYRAITGEFLAYLAGVEASRFVTIAIQIP